MAIAAAERTSCVVAGEAVKMGPLGLPLEFRGHLAGEAGASRGRDGVLNISLDAGPDDRYARARLGGGHDRRPSPGRFRVGRLDEPERMTRVERATDRDLGDGAGSPVRFAGKPGGQASHDDLSLRNAAGTGHVDGEHLEGE